MDRESRRLSRGKAPSSGGTSLLIRSCRTKSMHHSNAIHHQLATEAARFKQTLSINDCKFSLIHGHLWPPHFGNCNTHIHTCSHT